MVREELEQLFRRYSRTVFRRARNILGDDEEARDATQEVFLRAMHASEKLGAVDSPIAWLYRVTTNLCLNRLRDSARQRDLLHRTAKNDSEAAEPTVESALTLQTLLRKIPEELQEIAVSYFVDRMSQNEIADLTGLPRRTVGYRLEQFRALALEGTTPKEIAS
jgi:RNA polymerase sigma-70 factor (ECF subfamily)